MSDRLDEVKGNIKSGVGKVTGDEEMQAEGRGEASTAHAKREIKGAANQAGGKIEQGIGKLTGDEDERARGLGTEAKGDTQRAG